ncbi:MAG: hypothetical protein AAFV19_04510 [Pseudomonadota bacterium]
MDDRAEVPPVADVTPGWIGRNRRPIERGRDLSRVLMLAAPPPARVALAFASLGADALLIADDLKRRRAENGETAMRTGALVLEGVATLAATRFAPVRLAANLGAIEVARQMFERARKV